MNVWGDECLRWWTSEVMNVWGDECLKIGRGWWMSEVMNAWGDECRGDECRTILGVYHPDDPPSRAQCVVCNDIVFWRLRGDCGRSCLLSFSSSGYRARALWNLKKKLSNQILLPDPFKPGKGQRKQINWQDPRAQISVPTFTRCTHGHILVQIVIVYFLALLELLDAGVKPVSSCRQSLDSGQYIC